MDIGLGTSFAAVILMLLVQVVIILIVLMIFRPLFIWLFGVNEILAELRALRSELRGDTRQSTQRQPSNAPAPMFPSEPRERTVTAQGWGDAQADAESAARKMRFVD